MAARTNSEEASTLIALLQKDISSPSLRSEQRQATLERLKVIGRNPRDAAPIFTRDSIEMLAKYGFEGNSSPVSWEALRCLANALYLEPKARKIFAELGYAGAAADKLKEQNSNDEFLVSRILFLLTYDSGQSFEPLFEEHSLGQSINAHIARHSKTYTSQKTLSPTSSLSSDFDLTALSESLKLLFNLSNFYPAHVVTFRPAISSIINIMTNITLPEPALQAPITYLINALLNLDLDNLLSPSSELDVLFPPSNSSTPVDRLISILSLTLTPPTQPDLESLIPLLTLLRKIYQSAPPPTKQHIKTLLLPSASDRDLPLGQTPTLPSRLLRLSTTTSARPLSEAISSLLFDISDQNANTFVRNVGYGFAAGFLLSHNIPVPDSARIMQVENDDDEEEGPGEALNPVTGQRLSQEPSADDGAAEMTEEEREREAERLFVLFERLRATGVVDVGNPVREAVESGRFESDADQRPPR